MFVNPIDVSKLEHGKYYWLRIDESINIANFYMTGRTSTELVKFLRGKPATSISAGPDVFVFFGVPGVVAIDSMVLANHKYELLGCVSHEIVAI